MLDFNDVLSNFSACSDVLRETATVLRTATPKCATGSTSKEPCTVVNRSIELSSLVSCASQGTALCHHCALDPGEAIWTLASSKEGSNSVLMVLKCTLSKNSGQYMERVCAYRMQLPHDMASLIGPSMARRTLPPTIAQTNMDTSERLRNMKRVDGLLDQWYKDNGGLKAEDIFSPNVLTVRHIVDAASGERTIAFKGIQDVQAQKPSTFGMRQKHQLAAFHDAHNCLSYVQSYEIIAGEDGVQWRQSSMRIRVYDPTSNFRLLMGLIFYSERDALDKRFLRPTCEQPVKERAAPAAAAPALPAAPALLTEALAGAATASSSRERTAKRRRSGNGAAVASRGESAAPPLALGTA